MQKQTKWKREQLISLDKEQTLFNQNADLMQNNWKYAKKIIRLELNENVLCPFCLTSAKLKSFVIQNKKGINRHMVLCPTCKQNVQLKTILSVIKMDMQEFAKWVYEYSFSRNRFFNKVFPDFKNWNKKLASMNLAEDFWLEYKKLRGDRNYEDE